MVFHTVVFDISLLRSKYVLVNLRMVYEIDKGLHCDRVTQYNCCRCLGYSHNNGLDPLFVDWPPPQYKASDLRWKSTNKEDTLRIPEAES